MDSQLSFPLYWWENLATPGSLPKIAQAWTGGTKIQVDSEPTLSTPLYGATFNSTFSYLLPPAGSWDVGSDWSSLKVQGSILLCTYFPRHKSVVLVIESQRTGRWCHPLRGVGLRSTAWFWKLPSLPIKNNLASWQLHPVVLTRSTCLGCAHHSALEAVVHWISRNTNEGFFLTWIWIPPSHPTPHAALPSFLINPKQESTEVLT